MASNPYLELLGELGIQISPDEWNTAHGIEPDETPPPSRGAQRPLYIDEEDKLPVFSCSQVDYARPEEFGFNEYWVVEDDEHAHPFALNYDDEQYYRGNYRARHRYSRPYRIRWTLSHLIGLTGKFPKHVAERLQIALPPPGDVLHTRSAHEWVRGRLKTWGLKDLYLSVPFIVAQMGGPRWRVGTGETLRVYQDALRLHETFDALRRQGRLGRQRFPKLQYVLLKLLDRHGVVPPYRVPWARTSIKRRQLRDFLTRLDGERTPWMTTTTNPASADASSSPGQTGTDAPCDAKTPEGN